MLVFVYIKELINLLTENIIIIVFGSFGVPLSLRASCRSKIIDSTLSCSLHQTVCQTMCQTVWSLSSTSRSSLIFCGWIIPYLERQEGQLLMCGLL